MNPTTIFFDEFARLRSGWRFAIFVVGFLFLLIILGAVSLGLFRALEIPVVEGSAMFFLVTGMSALIPALFTGWLCGNFLEGLPFRALGAWFTKFWLKHLVLGMSAGAVTIGMAVLIAIAFGGLSFELNPNQGSTAILVTLGVSFVIFAVGAAWEEALFRGYILQTFSRAGFAWFAILLTSIFFGVVHIKNPDAGVISTANTILAGFWFAIAYLKTRDLWFVWGMHLIWNWMQGAIFGIEVSGWKVITTAPLLKEIDRGPTWLTGENYGIEGGIACTIAIVVSTAAIYFLPILKPSKEMLALTSAEYGVPASAGYSLNEEPTKAGTSKFGAPSD